MYFANFANLSVVIIDRKIKNVPVGKKPIPYLTYYNFVSHNVCCDIFSFPVTPYVILIK